MNFKLPFSLANLARDRKTTCRDEIRNKKWWEDGLQNWPESQFKKRPRINRNTFHFIHKIYLRFRVDINLETDHPSKTIYPSVSTS